jgi:hypothetical protein
VVELSSQARGRLLAAEDRGELRLEALHGGRVVLGQSDGAVEDQAQGRGNGGLLSCERLLAMCTARVHQKIHLAPDMRAAGAADEAEKES